MESGFQWDAMKTLSSLVHSATVHMFMIPKKATRHTSNLSTEQTYVCAVFAAVFINMSWQSYSSCIQGKWPNRSKSRPGWGWEWSATHSTSHWIRISRWCLGLFLAKNRTLMNYQISIQMALTFPWLRGLQWTSLQVSCLFTLLSYH